MGVPVIMPNSKKRITKTKVERHNLSLSVTAKALQKISVEQRRLDRQHEKLQTRSIREQRAAAASAIRSAKNGKKRILRILAEGDSWIKYDCGFGIMHYLSWALRGKAACVNIGGSGATMAGMMRLPARRQFEQQLREGIAGKPWDVLVFSGGGNDFAGERFNEWLLPFNGQTNPADAIAQPVFSAMLKGLGVLYGQLASHVATLSPDTVVLLNGYDFAIPNGKGVPFAGPWLAPGFDSRGYPSDLTFRTAVMKLMLEQFAQMLRTVCALYPFVRLVATQGLLVKSDWANELHPKNPGFEKVARVFRAQIEREFPA